MKLLKQNALLITFAIVMCAIAGYLLWTTTQPPDLPLATIPLTSPKPPPPGETAQGGHWHGDEWHAETHETNETFPAKPVSPVESYQPPPDAVTKPVFPEADPNASAIENAYKRLDYIKNNPYAWGGVHSPRATQLIEVLMPPPVLADHDQGEEVREQIIALISQKDPRAAAVLITTLCDGNMGGVAMEKGLIAIGPPAVPYVLAYLEKGVTEGGRVSSSVFDTLARIATEYPSDLGGITEHIILPKLARIAADTDFERHDSGTVYFAKKALAQLQ